MLTSFIACNDHIHIVTFLHYIDHFGELLRLMLKVIIHSYDELSLCVGKSAQKRRMLSKIPCHLDDLDTGIFFPEFLHNRKRPVLSPSSTRISSNSSFIVSRNTFSRRVYSSCSVCSELYTGTTTEYKHISFFLSFVSIDTYRLILSFSFPVVNRYIVQTFSCINLPDDIY